MLCGFRSLSKFALVLCKQSQITTGGGILVLSKGKLRKPLPKLCAAHTTEAYWISR
jgi:hypothetical protein